MLSEMIGESETLPFEDHFFQFPVIFDIPTRHCDTHKHTHMSILRLVDE